MHKVHIYNTGLSGKEKVAAEVEQAQHVAKA
jgi:hypothetical protein